METPDDSTTENGCKAHKDDEELHHGERRCRARSKTVGTQSKTRSTSNEIKESDRRNSHDDDKQRDQSTEQ